ncbi:MAG: response regulator transcription factor [Lysobacter sp.]|nr:response regulator transcription factor [Lysobacter sp.]
MRALIVEDEAIAARTLLDLLGQTAPELQLETPLGSVAACIERLSRPPLPDLMFMDVHLSDGLCFDILQAVPASIPIIFTTAYDQFALKAFDAFGIDYLLKPLRPERLALALSKWRQLTLAGAGPAPRHVDLAQAYFGPAQRYRERFLVATGQVLTSVPVSDIACFHKELVVRLVTREARGHVMSQSLDELMPMLDPSRFFRANRQTIVQIDAIARVHRGFKGKLELELIAGCPRDIVVSQERAGALRDWLGA